MNSFNNEANLLASDAIIVQVDPSNFRATVQKLTGAGVGAGASNDPLQQKLPCALSSRTAIEKIHKRAGLKLRERRRGSKKLELDLNATETTGPSRTIIRGLEGFGSEGIMASPVSTLELLALRSPRTPATPYQDEERAMAEKGFYLHPTPLPTPNGAEPPELLPLFPLPSP